MAEAQDFLDEVEQLLSRGHIYKIVDEFVTKLALCPRCRGGPEQTKLLRNTIQRMAVLVNKKMDSCSSRTRKLHHSWLQSAAKALEVYQLVDREWISANVWKLPERQAPKVQDYDPDRGRRDIRFYPNPELENLLEKAEGESMEVNVLDITVNEEDLLATPPRSTAQTESPLSQVKGLRSPRLTKRSPVESHVRKEVQLSKAEELTFSQAGALQTSSLQFTSAKDTVVSQPAPSQTVDSKQTSSLQPESSHTASSSIRDSSVRTSSSSEDTEQRPSRIPRKEHQTSPGSLESGTHRTSSHDSSYSRRSESYKESSRISSVVKGKQSVSSQQRHTPGVNRIKKVTWAMDTQSARQSRERPVYRPLGRGMTVEHLGSSDGPLKLPGSYEPLVISTTVLKKMKTDEVLRQVKKQVVEKKRPEVQNKERRCLVPGCVEITTYPKVHAFQAHVPGIFDERLPPSDERVLRGRRNARNQAARWLLGRPATLQELVDFVVIQKALSAADNTEVSQRQTLAMQSMCNFLKVTSPQRFTLEPANSPGVLIHWRAVLLIAATLEEEEREYWKKTFPIPESHPAEVEVQLPVAFDSHFHLDRTLRVLNLPPDGRLEDIERKIQVSPGKQIHLNGTVAVYCDPADFPAERDLYRLPKNMHVAVGFPPRHARSSIAIEEVDRFKRQIRSSRVTAFGEVGVDHTEPMKHWSYQVDLLQKVLPAVEDRHMLVLHCRGMRGDCGTEAYLLLLHFLKKTVRANQPIHLHCFTGNQYVVKRWLEDFPRTFFGFTSLVESFRPDQVEALQSIEQNRLLLESDSPYFVPRGFQVSSPYLLYYAAEGLAHHLQMPTERVLEVTTANALHLYGQQ